MALINGQIYANSPVCFPPKFLHLMRVKYTCKTVKYYDKTCTFRMVNLFVYIIDNYFYIFDRFIYTYTIFFVKFTKMLNSRIGSVIYLTICSY